MKKDILYFCLAALALTGCARTPKTGANDSAVLYLESWIHVNHPEAERTALGAYILSDTPGTGAEAGSADASPYVRVDYTVRSLAGTVQGTSDPEMAKQLGTFSEDSYYGPTLWTRSDNGLVAGLEEAVASMRVGGHRQLVVPAWLLGMDTGTGKPFVFKTAQEYQDKVTGGSPVIYDIKLVELIRDLSKWQCDSVGSYVTRYFPGKSAADSVRLGIYYIRTGEPTTETKFKNDTTIYINYIGRRLDGAVFDTSIADTAKYYGIYSASRTYGPCAVSWYADGEDYSKITMKTAGSSSYSEVVSGFALGLDQMHPFEKGSVVFTSNWGYGTRSSSAAIPAYSPLRFDFEVVAEPAS